ncbi:MAG: MATE family efflux transporter [Lachnospiraceae bacterium]|nr:MATE family efflux transporter [Lachnospiraceae bacterium]MBD5511829.1 MATE family efflux transporter [Lachnospiraceae bacterium]
MNRDLTEGNINRRLLGFALPLMAGNLLQQFYNIADTWVVGRFLGPKALAAVGSSYTLMVFLTSVFSGLCMGSGVAFSIYFGKKDFERLKSAIFLSFSFIGAVTLALNILLFPGLDGIIRLLRVPDDTAPFMKTYLFIIFMGITASFLYNYFACLLRAVGNSLAPLFFLGVSVVLNVALDLAFVLVFDWKVGGAAIATVMSQFVSAAGILIYTLVKFRDIRPQKRHMHWNKQIFGELISLSFLTCIQQSVMNLGILMVQGLINSFGSVVMAGYAAAVKIDSFAYMPVQDFGNAFSTFIAQNYGAGKGERIRKGIRSASLAVVVFCVLVGAIVCILANPLMKIFIDAADTDIIAAGAGYLRMVASCYIGIGFLFLFYGLYRAVHRPGFSVVLTVISLGTRVMLAYFLSAIPEIGVKGIWVAIPIGWFLADLTGAIGFFYLNRRKKLF